MKKIMTLVLAIVLLASLCLTGCQPAVKPTDPTKGTDAPDTKPTETTAPQLEEKTVQIWMGGPGKQKDADKVWAAFNELLKKYVPNTTVEFSFFDNASYGEKFTQMLAGEEPVDLAWTGWLVNIPNNVKDGNLMPLDDLIANYGKDIVEVMGQSVMDAHVYNDGKTYAIPSWQGLYGGRWSQYYVTDIVNKIADKDWVKKMQAAAWKFNEEPTAANLNALMDLMEKYYAAAEANDMLGAGHCIRTLNGWNWALGIDYNAASKSVVVLRGDDEFKYFNQYDGDLAEAYWSRMASWFDKGWIRKDFMSAEGLGEIKDGKITANTYISYMDGYWTEATVKATSDKWGLDVTAITCSSFGYVQQGYATSMGIPYCADEPERAMMVLNAIYANPDLYNLLIFGIEGEHYTVNADGTITTPYSGNNASSADAYGLPRWYIGSCKNSLINNGTEPDYYASLEKMEKDPSTRVSHWLGYVNDSSIYADWQPAITAAKKKYGEGNNVIAAGSAGWKAVHEAWMKEMEEAGEYKKAEAIQKRVDAWLKENNITEWQ